MAGESGLFVDPAEIPAADITRLGQAVVGRRQGDCDELMALTAAYSGLRCDALAALAITQADPAARVISVDRKVVEVAGHRYLEAPKNANGDEPFTPERLWPATHWPNGSLPATRLPLGSIMEECYAKQCTPISRERRMGGAVMAQRMGGMER